MGLNTETYLTPTNTRLSAYGFGWTWTSDGIGATGEGIGHLPRVDVGGTCCTPCVLPFDSQIVVETERSSCLSSRL